MSNPLASFFHRLDSHTKEVVFGASSAFVLRITGAALSFALSVVLGRLLGASGVGLYFLAFSVVTIAAVVGRVGLDNALLRFSAASASSRDWASLKGLSSKGLRLTLAASTLMALLVYLLAPWISTNLFSDPGLSGPLRLMAFGIVPTAFFTIVAQMLQGLRRTRDGIAVLSVWAPAFCLAGAVALVPSWGIDGAAAAYAIAAAFGAVVAWWRWKKTTPQIVGVAGDFPMAKLLHSSVPLFWVALSQLVITLSATVMLGIWSTSADVGIYGAASRIVVLLGFIALAVTSIASPKFSALHHQGDTRALGTLAKSSTALLILAASPAFAIFFLMPEKVMGLFGSEFAAGSNVVLILAMGQLVNIITGPAGNLLMMCGHERLVRNTLTASAFICVALNLLLIPPMGVIGAAIANAVTVTMENLVLLTLVWRKLGIMTVPNPFSVRGSARQVPNLD